MIVALWRRPAARTDSSGTSAKATARRRVAERSSPVAGAGVASWRTAAGTSAPRATVAAAVRATRVAPVTRSRAKGGRARPRRRARARRPGAVGRLHRRMAGGVEQQHRHLDRGDAVDQRVVRLPDHRPAVGAQPADQVDVPQRVARVEWLREQRPGEIAQLARAGRRRERHRVDVAGDVEARVVGPVRVAEAEPRAHDAPAEARHVLEASLDVAAQRRQRRRAARDPDRPSDVQRRLRAVEIEEGGIQAAQTVDRLHAGMIPRVTGAPSVDFVARRADPDRVRRLFELVEEALRSKAPAQGDALVATLGEHLSAWQPCGPAVSWST